MDRYQFLPMGRRRPWVLGAQLGMTLSFFGLVLVDNPADQLGLLMALGLLINVFAATQDVAVDGMSIDVTPVNEQGRLNGFMVFGKAIGWASTAAVTGTMLVEFGLGVTAIAGAATALALGPMIDRFGAKRMLVVTISLVAIHAFLLAETQYLWENTTYVKVMLAASVLLGPVTMVCMIAIIFFHRHRAEETEQRERAPSYTVGMGAGSGGLYFSGAMRCPDESNRRPRANAYLV